MSWSSGFEKLFEENEVDEKPVVEEKKMFSITIAPKNFSILCSDAEEERRKCSWLMELVSLSDSKKICHLRQKICQDKKRIPQALL
jgi:hypothetical protein